MNEFTTVSQLWARLAEQTVHNGLWVTSRNGGAREIIDGHGYFNMRWPLLNQCFRKLGYSFAVTEALWILGGYDSLSVFPEIDKHLSRFSDDGLRLDGAYGPKWKAQKDYALQTLLNASDSRQAVITFWQPNPTRSKDIPCSISLQFLIRQGRLHAIYTMRSSDLWLGFPYDMFTFTMLTTWMALSLRSAGMPIELGYMFYRAGSMHLYDGDAESVQMEISTAAHSFKIERLPLLNLGEFVDTADFIETLFAIRAKDPKAKWLGGALYGS